MGKILNAEEGTHIVENYSFKAFDDDTFVDTTPKEEVEEDTSSTTPSPSPPPISDKHFQVMEQLLKKSDDISNTIIKLEQALSNKDEQCQKRIDEIKESNYKFGYNEGYNEAKRELENRVNEHLSKLIESLHKIDKVYQDYQNKAENIEKELVAVAVDIAQEVIAKELSKHSKEIALSLTKELINDIKEATKIEIKVNPLDYDYVKDKINLDKITIKPDNAISPGGVVIISDVGNIEAEIAERFKVIKNNILKVR